MNELKLNRTSTPRLCWAAVAALACGDEATVIDARPGDEDVPPRARAESAVVIATTIQSGDQANTYLTAYPQVPEGRLNTGGALEFAGWAWARTWKQYLFVYESESARMRRYVVSADYTLVQDGPDLAFTIAGASEGMDINMYDDSTAYAAPYSPGQVSIVEWDPLAMEVRRIIDTDLPSPAVGSFLDSAGFVGQFEGAETWHVYGNDGEALEFNDQAMLGFLEPGAAAMTIIEHTGCAPNIKGYVLGGDLYVVGGGTNAEQIANYNVDYAARAPNCILRVNAGTRQFDPDYFLNLTEITGSRAIQNTKYFDEEHLIVEYWDPADAFPELPDDYWTAASYKSLELNLRTGEAVPVDDLFPKGTQASYEDFVFDGAPHFTTVATGFGETAVHRAEGGVLREVFSTPGYLRLLQRLQ